MVRLIRTALAVLLVPAQAVDLSNLAAILKDISAVQYPQLQPLAADIWKHPEVGLSEHHAHDIVVKHFQHEGIWRVTPHSYGMDTAWTLDWEHHPAGWTPAQRVPTIGFLAEYDGLVGIGHACGHNHILLNGILAATMARDAILKLDIPARIIVQGTPDEENTAGKYTLQQAGAFKSADVWFIAHPTNANAVQPMNSRLNAVYRFVAKTHEDAVRSAYNLLVKVRDLATGGGIPGTSSSATCIEDVGMFASNIVQSAISLGISGMTLADVNTTVASILDKTYPNVTYTVSKDNHGVNLTAFGPGGHASESTKGPLVLTTEVFRKLSAQSDTGFYLPGNTSALELDITVDLRTRYTQDLDSVLSYLKDNTKGLTDSITTDLPYPSLEITPYLPDMLIDLLKTPDYGSQNWSVSTFAPASTDASWLQNAVVDPTTKAFLSADKVVFHPNFGICEVGGTLCAFNHEPTFAKVAGTDYSYSRTEIIARALAHMAIELLNDKEKYGKATAILKKT
ncbi:hypothetical protein BGZ63DRAFT_348697 [Mariannaea sp. PMI_226]|nr:hypothetical protein BGZ63DRAFT_348697 [Mariannaea sp. PMI_226]